MSLTQLQETVDTVGRGYGANATDCRDLTIALAVAVPAAYYAVVARKVLAMDAATFCNIVEALRKERRERQAAATSATFSRRELEAVAAVLLTGETP